MTSQVTARDRVYSVIGWLIERSYFFLGATVTHFFITTTLLYLFVKKPLWDCLFESLYVLMGDTPTMLTADALVDFRTTITFLSLLLLRFLGWLILPLVVGIVIDATEKRIEQQQQQIFLDEIELIRGREWLDEYSENELVKLGVPQEKAHEIIKNNRKKFWEYYREQIESK